MEAGRLSDNRPPLTLADVEALDERYPGDMARGYRDGRSNAPWPAGDPSPAYEHGRRNGVHDRTHTSDADSRRLAAEFVRGQG